MMVEYEILYADVDEPFKTLDEYTMVEVEKLNELEVKGMTEED